MIPADAADRLQGLKKRVERAQDNFLRFHNEELAYFANPKPYEWRIDINHGPPGLLGATGQVVLKIVTRPPDWGLLVADIITDLRFALDYLAYELVVANTAQDPPPDPRGIEFPVYTDGTLFAQLNRQGQPAGRSGLRKIKNMDPQVQAWIEHIQPYNNTVVATPEADGLWLLDEMCNVYKHRLLAPMLFSVDKVDMKVGGFRCTLTDFHLHESLRPLNDETVFASFSSPDFGMESKVRLEAAPSFMMVFPQGTPAKDRGVSAFLSGAVGTVRWIVQETTRRQWAEPLGLAGPDHTMAATPPHGAPPT